MYCDRCGAGLPDPARFCPQCGKQFGVARYPATQPAAPPPPVAQSRVAGNLRTLAILWMVYSGYRLLPGLVLHSMDSWGIPLFDGAPFFVHNILHVVGGALVLTGLVGLLAGWGLLERQTWARVLAIILGFLSLLHPPLGTALGIYTLWVLLPASSEAEYLQLARR